MIITVDRIESDQGSIVVFSGKNRKGDNVGVAVDHRMAQDIADVVFADGACDVEAESWQIVGAW